MGRRSRLAPCSDWRTTDDTRTPQPCWVRRLLSRSMRMPMTAARRSSSLSLRERSTDVTVDETREWGRSTVYRERAWSVRCVLEWAGLVLPLASVACGGAGGHYPDDDDGEDQPPV